ncbi:MAG TPA: adenylosuccinate lyase family protein [Vicinamibacteria bacterium]|nr:adenylosuccinate lyase family protein [Vicinamibacteria bacterium]
MPTTVFDSFYFKDRFGTERMREIWADRATHQRWLDVEAALAEAEAEVGVIPKNVAREISRRAKIENLDLAAMKVEFDRSWNPVVPLVNALRKAVSPRTARYVHWGCTSKNIFDTGMILQIKESYDLLTAEVGKVADQLADLAERHRETIMAGRTHGQHAIPITFGFKAATWLDEVNRQRERLLASRPRVLVGEFGGAVGTLASLGRKGLRVQKHLMAKLGLGVPAIPVKTAGDRLAEFVLLLCLLSATLGKIAQNIYNLQQTEIDEVTEFTEGKIGSSAMPHKQNPVASGAIVFLGRLLRSNAGAALEYVHAEWEDDHRQGETAWKFVPEVCLLASAQLSIMQRLLEGLIVKPDNMRRNLERGGGLQTSEALLMALSEPLGRDRAHELVTELATDARCRGVSFSEIVAEHPVVLRHLSRKEIARCLDYRSSTGLSALLVDRVLMAHRKAARRQDSP